MNFRKYIPYGIRLKIKRALRHCADWRSGYLPRFAKKETQTPTLPFHLKVTQPVYNSYLFENKVKNINRAGKSIKKITIHPNEIFSFWHTIGRPSAENGFLKGRNILDGVLKEDYGGGLCQLAGIIYHTALIAGLEIIERHNHSIDLYEEKDRYTPLGADATVVYGYKDLRIVNNKPFPIKFHIVATGKSVICKLFSQQEIIPVEIDFLREYNGKTVKVFTREMMGDKSIIRATSVYGDV